MAFLYNQLNAKREGYLTQSEWSTAPTDTLLAPIARRVVSNQHPMNARGVEYVARAGQLRVDYANSMGVQFNPDYWKLATYERDRLEFQMASKQDHVGVVGPKDEVTVNAQPHYFSQEVKKGAVGTAVFNALAALGVI